MPEPNQQRTLLEELDERQDEVLAQLEELNSRVEKLLKEPLFQQAPAATSDSATSAAGS